MILKDDIAIMNEFPTPEFPYSVTYLFPYKLYREEIFQNNLSHILSDLKELIKEMDLLEYNQRVLECAEFDSQKEKQLSLIRENEERISEIDNQMNDGISPYCWCILKDFDDYFDNHYVKADYLLVLEETI